ARRGRGGCTCSAGRAGRPKGRTRPPPALALPRSSRRERTRQRVAERPVAEWSRVCTTRAAHPAELLPRGRLRPLPPPLDHSITSSILPARDAVRRMIEAINKLRKNISSVFLGNPQAVDRVICCLLARGHILIEDVPGVGKTVLATAMARSIDCSFS